MLILQSPSNFYFFTWLIYQKNFDTMIKFWYYEMKWINCIYSFLWNATQISFVNVSFSFFLNKWESFRRIASYAITVALLTRAFGSKSVVSLCMRIQYKIASTTEFQKPRHVDPVSSTLSPVRWANSIRPFSTRLPMLSRNPIRKAGGMHQLVKLRYLTSPPFFLPFRGQPVSSVSILSFRTGSKLRLVTKISIYLRSPPLQDRQLGNTNRKVLDLVLRATFPS